MIGVMKCMYWLCKFEVPYSTNFVSLLDLAKYLCSTYLNEMVGRNACYTSEWFMQETVCCLGKYLEMKYN